MTDNERDELKRCAAGVAIDKLGEEEFFRRVNVASRMLHQTLASHFGDDPLGMVLGLIALDHVADSATRHVKGMVLRASDECERPRER
jgi:hypothetical protein